MNNKKDNAILSIPQITSLIDICATAEVKYQQRSREAAKARSEEVEPDVQRALEKWYSHNEHMVIAAKELKHLFTLLLEQETAKMEE